MPNNIEDFLAILFGIFLILSRKWQSKTYAKYQNDFYGLHFSPRLIKIGELLNIVGGVVFIVIGILGMFGFIS